MVGRAAAGDQAVRLSERLIGRRSRCLRAWRGGCSARLCFCLCFCFCLVVAAPAFGASGLTIRPGQGLGSPTSATAEGSAIGSPATQPHLSVRAAILVDELTGQVLYASNPDAELPIASTTKLMTALLTLEHVHRLSTMFTAPDYYAASSDSQIGLAPGERMSVHDLLLALLIPSADDAAEDLAYNVGGHSVARFIGMMNASARELGLSETHYSTPSGLDSPGNYSSARDLVKLSVYLLEHYRWFRNAVKLQHALLRTGNHPRYVVSTNTLLSEVPWINGVKTGHTADAGYVLVGSGTRDGTTLVSAVLGTDSEAARDSNTLALLGYGFSDFRLERAVVSGRVVARPTVSNSPGARADVIAAGGVAEVVARTARLTTRIDVPHQLSGPLKRHAVVGSIVVSSGRRVLARVPAELARALPAVSALTIVGRFLLRPSTLVLLVLLIGGASVVVRRRREGRRTVVTAQYSSAATQGVAAGQLATVADAAADIAAAGAPDGGTPADNAPDIAAAGAAAAVADGAPAAAGAVDGEPAGAEAAPVASAADAERAAEAERQAAAERLATVERERRRAERAARRAADKRDPAPSSTVLQDGDRG
jgi:D-alanyl-D-alanine carboxypeptidase (penicillin-binding protein 5/6)